MRRLCACGVMALALCSLAPNATSKGEAKAKKATPLVVEGDTFVVVRTLPCKVTAPAGADLYLWGYPDAVKASPSLTNNSITVTAAPKGTSRITVTLITVEIDFEKKTKRTITESLETDLIYGGEGPTPPPPPNPDDPLVKDLKAAYKADADAKKAEYLVSLASLYRTAAKMDLGAVDTAARLSTILSEARSKLLPADALVGVRKVIQTELRKILPTAADEKLTKEHKDAALKLFERLGVALVEAGK